MTCKCAEEDNGWNLAEGEEVPAVCTNYVEAYDEGLCWFCGHLEACHPQPIKVWRFADAPKEYRELSEHGGDEDWVIFVPDTLADEYLDWLESYVHYSEPQQVDGGNLYITAHA